jgi:hypothetical protein
LRFQAIGMGYPLDGVVPLPKIAGDRHGGAWPGRPSGALAMRGRAPVLWVTGLAGVGKSSIS